MFKFLKIFEKVEEAAALKRDELAELTQENSIPHVVDAILPIIGITPSDK